MSKQSERQVDLAAQLREAIRASGLNRHQLARRAGIQYSALWRFVQGESRDPTISTASRLLTAMGLRVELRPTGRSKKKG